MPAASACAARSPRNATHLVDHIDVVRDPDRAHAGPAGCGSPPPTRRLAPPRAGTPGRRTRRCRCRPLHRPGTPRWPPRPSTCHRTAARRTARAARRWRGRPAPAPRPGTPRARAGLDATDVEDVCAVGDQRLGPGQERVELEVAPRVVERVGRAVQDADDHRSKRDVEAVGTELEEHEATLPGSLRRPIGPNGRRTRTFSRGCAATTVTVNGPTTRSVPSGGTDAPGTVPPDGSSTAPTDQRWRSAAVWAAADGATRAEDDEVHPTDAGLAERREEPIGRHARGELDDGRSAARHTTTPAAGSLRSGGSDQRSTSAGTTSASTTNAVAALDQQPPCDADADHDRGHAGHEQDGFGWADVAERPPRCSLGHAGDPGDHQPGRQMEQRRDRPSDDAGDEASAQAPHHDQPGDRNGEQVGRDGGRPAVRRSWPASPAPRRPGRPA